MKRSLRHQYAAGVPSTQHPLLCSGVTFDHDAFMKAVERQRQRLGLSWRELARQLGLSASTFTRLARGSQPDLATFLTLLAWLDVPAETFIDSPAQPSDTLAVVTRSLRADPALEPTAAAALEDLIRVAYLQLSNTPQRPRSAG